MKRKTFDLILTLGGGMLVVVLVVAGVLLMWGSSFANSNVHNQLAKQEIDFPAAAAFAHAKPGTEITPTMKAYLLPYAGQQLLTGTQAQAYATHFIAIHLSEMPYGGVYSKISAASQANPSTKKLSALATTSFQGTTLRGLLLEAYAFSVFGTIAFWAGIAAFVLGFLMLLLTGLGLWHLKRTPEDAEFPSRHREKAAA
ncbi:MAG: hypothetical protein ACYDHU_09335 [Acidimicrobiales bacterium]